MPKVKIVKDDGSTETTMSRPEFLQDRLAYLEDLMATLTRENIRSIGDLEQLLMHVRRELSET